jgi:hypothetical protein
MSRAAWNRRSGAFSRQWCDDPFERRWHGPCSAVSSGGSLFRIAEIVSAAVSPRNARAPGNHLVEHRAEAEDVGPMIDRLRAHLLRRHVAGRAQHDADARLEVPRRAIVAPAATGSGSRSLARPKSRILMRPSRVMNRFSGLRSRWTTPLSWAAARPPAICVA